MLRAAVRAQENRARRMTQETGSHAARFLSAAGQSLCLRENPASAQAEDIFEKI